MYMRGNYMMSYRGGRGGRGRGGYRPFWLKMENFKI